MLRTIHANNTVSKIFSGIVQDRTERDLRNRLRIKEEAEKK